MQMTTWETLREETLEYVLIYIKRKKHEFTASTPNDIIVTLDKFNDFEESVMQVINKNGCIRFREFEAKCEKYIKYGNRCGNKFMTSFFSRLYEDGIYRFPRRRLKLCFYENLFSDPTADDIEYCEDNFNSKCSAIMMYKKTKFYILGDRDCAAILDEQNLPAYFPMDWDWWFNIDTYLFKRMK